jgi:16S rRNA processing protein RimM
MAYGTDDNHSATRLIRIGYVSGVHGVRGAIRVRPDNPESTLLRHVERLTLAQGAERAEYRVIEARPSGRGKFKVTLEGLNETGQASNLRGAIVMVAATELPPANPREFYYFEAIGCGVITSSGVPVGVIEEVFSNGANDVWVVRDGSSEYLVPVIEDIVKHIDVASRRVIIDAVPGLLE